MQAKDAQRDENKWLTVDAEQKSFDALTIEYRRLIHDYDYHRAQDEMAESLKDQERQERERIRLQREQERQQDRRQREEERQRKLDEAEAQRLAEEALYIPHDFSAVVISEPKRMEHTHILGGTGHGKTTLILAQMMQDLRSPNPPAYVVVDGKGTLIDKLKNLRIFENNDRLVLLDAQDRIAPPALNMFTMPKRTYSDNIREQIENRTIDSFGYIFSSTDTPLTRQMSTLFSYAVRLLFSIPGASIDHFLDLMGDRSKSINDSPFKTYIDQLPHRQRRFFYEDFYNAAEFGQTKQKIRNRINGVLDKPTFDAMFSAEECKFDFFDAIQSRKVVLINAPKPFIGEDAAQLFGRWAIAKTLSAAFERLAIPRHQWNPAYLIIDEAQEFVDELKTPELIQQAREFNLGITIAHQNIKGHLSDNLYAAVASSTSSKFVGGCSAQDAGMMAKDMQCDPEFIMAQRQIPHQETRFACFVKGVTDRAISVRLPLGAIEREPTMSIPAYEAFLRRNRARLHVPRKPPTAEPPKPPPQPPKPPPPPPPPARNAPLPPPPELANPPSRVLPPNVVSFDKFKEPRDPGEPSDTW